MFQKKKKKSQVATEFMIVFGAALFFFTVLFVTIQYKNEDKINQRIDLAVKGIALNIQNEFQLAAESSEGYSRDFKIPNRADILKYKATVTDGLITVVTNEGNHAASLPIPPVKDKNGIPGFGNDGANIEIELNQNPAANTIKRENGDVNIYIS